MQFLTDFADQAVILPAFLALTLTLLATDRRPGALAWSLVVAATLGSVFALKVAAQAFPAALEGWDLHSPSGHVAAGAILYGGLAALLFPRNGLALLFAAAVALLVAATRLSLGVHTVAEVVVGGTVGLAGVLLIAALAPTAPRPEPRLVLPVVLLTVVGLMHGQRLTAEGFILQVARRLSSLMES